MLSLLPEMKILSVLAEISWNAEIELFLYWVLARPYLITLYIIFPTHLKFPIRSRCVLKAIIHKKNNGLFYGYLIKFFLFQKDTFYDIVHACGIWLIFLFSQDLFLFFMFLCQSISLLSISLSIIFAISHSIHVILSQYL